VSDKTEATAVVVADKATVVSPGTAQGSEAPAGLSADDLAKVRDLYLRANPNVVPELVSGSSLAELEASLGAAKAAYDRIVAAQPATAAAASAAGGGPAAVVANGAKPGVTLPPAVPAGATPATVNVEALPTSEKIKRGLAARQR
jgi:hypothetical protein